MKGASSNRLQSGNFTIDVLRGHQKIVFRTNPVELKESNLVGAWTNGDGAKPNAQDKLAGLAVEFTRADNYSPSLHILRRSFKRNRNRPKGRGPQEWPGCLRRLAERRGKSGSPAIVSYLVSAP